MNELTYKLYSFAIFVALIGVILLAMLTGFNHTVDAVANYATTSLETKAEVDIARLDAQARITVGCEENSWFTPMTTCMREGGVNGVPGINWWFWFPVLCIVAVVLRKPLLNLIDYLREGF